MLINNILITSHSADEAITKCVSENKGIFNNNITIILLDQLLNEYKIFDEFSDTNNTVRWFIAYSF